MSYTNPQEDLSGESGPTDSFLKSAHRQLTEASPPRKAGLTPSGRLSPLPLLLTQLSWGPGTTRASAASVKAELLGREP